MMDDYGHWGWGAWLGMSVFMLLCVAAIVAVTVLVVRATSKDSSRQ